MENWHGLMEAQQGPVNNLNNPIEPAVQQVIIIMVIIALIIIFIIIIFIMNSLAPCESKFSDSKKSKA